jgi:ribosome biogenesis GTPase
VRGTIVKALSGFYYVRIRGDAADGGEVYGAGPSAYGEPDGGPSKGRIYCCRARGLFKKEGVSPLVGDEVVIDLLDEEDGFITVILPRRNAFIRPAVANIDLFVATMAVCDPPPNPETLDRFLAAAEAASADAVVCVNKTDLGPPDPLTGVYGGIYDTLPVSAVTGSGMDALKARLTGRRAAFAGPSGVGKSSLINFLLGGNETRTNGVSRKTRRGRHTTRHVELFGTDFGAELFDTPGYTSFDGATVAPEEIGGLFPEIARLSGGCRYGDCTHADEPGCVVRDAVGAGGIAPGRYRSYLRLLNEALENRRKGMKQ